MTASRPSIKLRALGFFAPMLVSCMAVSDLHAEIPPAADIEDSVEANERWVPVSGVGTHYFTTALIHSSVPTPTGFVQRSTDTVELEGDLVGRVIYHPVSVFDFAAGTLTNTGSQVFSGTVLGSAPVLLHDDEFRVEVDLATGTTFGRMFLMDHLAGPKIRCRLEIRGAGVQTPEGDAVVDYSGACRLPGPQANGPIEP